MLNRKKKILVVEDEKPIARALELKLTSMGYELYVASDGEVAKERITHGSFDLIVLDLVLPKVDGFQILQWIVDQKIKTPVIVTSNLSQEEDMTRAKSLGAKDYFVKSEVPVAEVVARIKKILSS